MRDELLKMEAEYDIPDEVDMSGAVRGYFYTPHKVSDGVTKVYTKDGDKLEGCPSTSSGRTV